MILMANQPTLTVLKYIHIVIHDLLRQFLYVHTLIIGTKKTIISG